MYLCKLFLVSKTVTEAFKYLEIMTIYCLITREKTPQNITELFFDLIKATYAYWNVLADIECVLLQMTT